MCHTTKSSIIANGVHQGLRCVNLLVYDTTQTVGRSIGPLIRTCGGGRPPRCNELRNPMLSTKAKPQSSRVVGRANMRVSSTNIIGCNFCAATPVKQHPEAFGHNGQGPTSNDRPAVCAISPNSSIQRLPAKAILATSMPALMNKPEAMVRRTFKEIRLMKRVDRAG